MEYVTELGESEQTIAKQAMRSGRPIPDRILNAPRLEEAFALYLTAFFELDSERSNANGPTPIPWRSIAEYAAVFEFSEDQREDLFYFVRKLDAHHLGKMIKKQQAGSKHGRQPARPRR